jgi:hypothetical protein
MGNEVVFARLWKDPEYIKLHTEKDKLAKLAFGPKSEWKHQALEAWRRQVTLIEVYEAKAGVK